MKPKVDDAIKNWDIVVPAVQQVLKLVGVQVQLGSTPQDAVHRITQALNLSSPKINVTWLQSALQRLGHDVGQIDGIFGHRTFEAVKTFQKDHHLTVDGWPGPETVTALQEQLRKLELGK
jgi:peptidoglycan hydrolase-like protein with peptidoglycan-binding domain